MRPKTVGDNARGLAAFGIPLRFSGGFGTAKASLDSDFLGDVIQARAAAEARNVITDRIGGTGGDVVGGLLGSIIGGKTPAAKPAPAPQTPATEPPNPETTEAEETPEPEPTPEDRVEDALKGLFGVKKRD